MPIKISEFHNWHSMDAKKALTFTKSSHKGLDDKEAKKRLSSFGANILPHKKPISLWFIFFDQFATPLVYILLISSVVSLFFRHYTDSAIIMAAVVLNAAVGFFQEYKANDSLEKLRNFIVPTCLVVRNGKAELINSTELVSGDIIHIQNGKNIPADLRIIESEGLEVNESILTGESASRKKSAGKVHKGTTLSERSSMAFMGTVVVRGKGLGVVVATGGNTEIGKISGMVEDTDDAKTPLQSRLSHLSNQLGLATVAVCLLIFIAGIVLGDYDPFQIFISSVAVAVASVPEGMPIAVTVILTVGMQFILKKKALVRKLVATETLGSITAICTDKTGTLTEGKMHITNILFPDQKVDLVKGSFTHEEPELIFHALRIGLHCNDAVFEEGSEVGGWKVNGMPTDEAIMTAAVQANLNYAQEKTDFPLLSELQFDSDWKYMATVHQSKIKTKYIKSPFILFVKGAPEIVLSKSKSIIKNGRTKTATDKDRSDIRFEIEKLTGQGLRLVALASRALTEEEATKEPAVLAEDLVFIGLAVIKDPIRPEARETIKICQQAGIRPIIITGDYGRTAKAIAAEVGLKVKDNEIVEGSRLEELDDEELKHLVKKVCIFARVSPGHKLRIINALRANKESVAMVGDGVNDAPAIKAADIGIALGSGTDVAKETSDIILLDNNFSTIVAAIEQGRVIFSNIRKVITYLISDIFSEMILVTGSIIFGMPLAILPAQILWLNIVNDGFPNFALAFEKGDENIMKAKPIAANEPILNAKMKAIIFGLGLVRDTAIFILFIWLYNEGREIDVVRTTIFAILGVKSLFSLFSLRNLETPLWRMNPFSNKYILMAISLSLGLIVSVIYWRPLGNLLSTVPLPLESWYFILGIGIANIAALEAIKSIFNRRNGKE